jgi:hypothetical protein
LGKAGLKWRPPVRTACRNTALFELDFDQSFKDQGPLDAQCEMVLPLVG